ncbi:hypothetical protein CIHG_09177 [Coccidioides immitis H538.4]|uniref:DUF7137 domain-containing protein n=3 Tax=Coccidioides immitis TaxID=5501 RepID=A0A0J8R6S4_COCIT|nr:hypothetical protein CIRG_05935 [Coccidioides immitis RMSCC 2394]KMU80541.1 hypothetical protein CISG_02392 [Coccidioides immitis RMSCC 3703]KMU91300.1 hypothetical protein CIHG_09177 [Coccidioides immitis H538.4]TPX22737.1 hypothetical protein DIZ76_014616 [Coccidioides immitis]
MRTFSFILLICSLLVLVSSVAASYPPERRYPNNGFAKRQDSETITETPEPTGSTDPTGTNTRTPERTGTNTDSPSETGTKTDAETGTDAKSTGTKTTKPKVTSVDPRLPPGGIKLITPAPLDGSTYIKIGDYATFAWNYTSVKITPSAVDVVAYCSRNKHAYTIAANQSFAETGMVTWNTNKTDVPLLTEIYTLLVYDVEVGPSDLPGPGQLGAQPTFRFGVYKPQEYTPLSKSECVTCLNNAAVSETQQQAFFFMFGMIVITICSFSWFASGFGLFA